MSGQPLIHIVDDNEAVRDSLALLLECADMTVRTYPSAEALLVRPPAGDCLITDVQMAGMDGLELLRRLRAQGADLPVIVITARADPASAEAAVQAGAASYVEKPFAPEAILGAVEAALRRSA